MKNLMLGAMIVAFSSTTFAEVQSCDEKMARLETQIQNAKDYHNTYKQQGLETALANVKLHCKDDVQIQKANNKIQEKKLKLAERENELKKAQLELEEAKIDGRSDKITDKQKKVMEKQMKLKKARLELQETQNNPLVN